MQKVNTTCSDLALYILSAGWSFGQGERNAFSIASTPPVNCDYF